ncbi:MAG TPA: L,D-transpeptidase family protein [Telluria sp.]
MKIKHGNALALSLLLLLPLGEVLASPADDIRALAASASQIKHHDSPYEEQDWLERFYSKASYAPAWKIASARAAVALLKEAPANGLSGEDYNAEALSTALRADSIAAATDVALTEAMLHYLADLKVGRVRSEYHTTLPDPRLSAFDPVEQLRAALAQNQLPAAVEAAQPQVFLYKKVKVLLAQYRELAKQAEMAIPPLADKTKVEAGSAYPHAGLLRQRLALLGDLGADAPATPNDVYTKVLADAVRKFQARNALTDDGVLGRGTIAALNVPLRVRVRQLELTLERLRWLPDFGPGPIIAVNLPTFRLWAFHLGMAEPPPPVEMRVIVGTAVKNETPLFIGSMRYVEFNPYWNVPKSIEKAEIIPKLKAKPNYLVDNQMELVPLSGAGAPIQTVDAETMQGLVNGKFRVRQRPGPSNALGAVKFAMPNPDNIYLHSTSARELFKKTRRDLSHGCIRVEKPVELAQFVLAGNATMTAEDIEKAMEPAPMRTVSVKPVIPVVLFYATAITDQHGTALFAQDIYGRDPALEAALAGRYPKPAKR